MRFTQDLNDWDVGLVVEYLHFLESNTPLTENGDQLRWTLKKYGNFDICSHYKTL